MGLPRSRYVQEGQEGVYHCFSRCVRRAFLCGFDAQTGKNFSHRKAWFVERLRTLSAVFAIDVFAFAVMDDHHHTILRTRPDRVSTWSDREVARRWLTLFPRRRSTGDEGGLSFEEEIDALAGCPERIRELRQRLSSLSWFMGRLNEFIARAANKEDEVKGRFWESRFKCQALLDEAAILAGMVYVDLNPIRAGLAESPEKSKFTSIQQRIRAWQADVSRKATTESQSDTPAREMPEDTGESSNLVLAAPSDSWLCPIESDSQRRGILQMTAAEYFDLVDRSGRMVRSDKRGAIDAHLAPILLRIGARPEAWLETISNFGSSFHLAAGLLSSLRRFADQIGSRWLKGIGTARLVFVSTTPQPA